MKRVKISVILIIFMIALSVFFNYRISKNCDNLISIIEVTEENVRNNDKEKALESAYEFERNFKKFHSESMLMVMGNKLSEAENCYVRIIPLIETDNDELLPELAELKNILLHLKKSETPVPENIF